VLAVAKTIAEHEEFLAEIHYRLEQAQVTQKFYYDHNHRQVSYHVGDWALLRLRQRASSSLPRAVSGKLQPRYCGLYRITELINDVSIRLALPPGARIHDVFHVGLLKKFQGEPPTAPPTMPPLHHGAINPERACVMRYRVIDGVPHALIQWKGASAASATWEDTAAFRAKYPAFQLEDELTLGGEGDVMFGRKYIRRRRARDVRHAKERTEQQARATQGDALGAGSTSG
jgi:hypothetical protein